MQIDLNNSESFTLENVRLLIQSKDDSQDRQLRVDKNGIAFLSDKVGHHNIDGLLFRFETWGFGSGYCGKAAAADNQWVTRVYKALRANWPTPSFSYLDIY